MFDSIESRLAELTHQLARLEEATKLGLLRLETDIEALETDLDSIGTNPKKTLSISWFDALEDYLSSYQLPFITLKELLIEPLGQLGGNPDSKADLMKVGKLLSQLGWKKLGKRIHRGKYQQVWCRRNAPKEITDKRIRTHCK